MVLYRMAMPSAEPVEVHVVDDDASMLRSVQRLLRSHGFQAAGYASAAEFLEATRSLSSGCLILDYKMPGLSGLELQEMLASGGAQWQVIFLSGKVDVAKSVKAMKNGAIDVLVKPTPDAALIAAVERALERNRVAIADRQKRADIEARVARLTRREREVMMLVLAGKLNKQIAAALGTAERTVKTQRALMLEKMGVRSVAQLVHLAERIGIRPE
jgi:FixJ family two-component response regulator